MPLDNLPGKLIVLTRDQRRDRTLRDIQFRNPAAVTAPGTQPYMDASVLADATDIHISNAVTIANSISRATAQGLQLDDWAARQGTKRLPPSGGSGAVTIVTGTNTSVALVQGDTLSHPSTGLRFSVTTSGSYGNGAQVPISGVDTGTATNLPAGTLLNWQAQRPGLGPTATVVLQADGSGLSNGNPAESDDQLRARLDYLAFNPPASGNDAQYQATISTAAGLSVQQAFTIPACKGPGSKGLAFTLRPSTPGANRIPNSTQLALTLAAVQGLMPADDGIYPIALVASPIVVVVKVLWAAGAATWVDAQQWPPYLPSPNLVVAGVPASGGLTPTNMRLSSSGLSGATAPQVGQNIAFLDLPNLTYRRKKILTVTAVSATQYDVTIDTTSGVSDTGYTPTVSQPCCPWSDALSALIPPITAYFDALGPGEQTATLPDPGLRGRRSPPSPQFWPNIITNRMLGGAASQTPASGAAQNLPPTPTFLTTPSLQDVILQEPTVPYATPVGTPGLSLYLLTLSTMLAFPE